MWMVCLRQEGVRVLLAINRLSSRIEFRRDLKLYVRMSVSDMRLRRRAQLNYPSKLTKFDQMIEMEQNSNATNI